MYRTNRFLLLSSLVLVGSLLFAGPIWAQLLTEEPLRAERHGLHQDAELYAADYGVARSEAYWRLRAQDRVSSLQEELSTSESFGGLWIEHRPDFSVVLAWTKPGEVPEEFRRFDSGPFSGHLRLLPVPRSLVDLEDLRDEVATLTRIAGLHVDLDIDVRKNRVEVYSTEPARVRSLLRSSELLRAGAVAVVPVTEPARPTSLGGYFYGGLKLDNSNFGYCTSGFAVQSGSTYGVLTAGHCEDSATWTGGSLTFQGQVCGSGSDVQWHTHGITKPWFQYSSSGAVREVYGQKSRANQVIGEYICKQGQTTGQTCGNLISKSFQPGWLQCSPHTATYLRLNASSSLVLGGDSGGPVYSGNTAYGLVSGSQYNNGTQTIDLIYMGIDKISGLGVSLRTGTPASGSCQTACWYQLSDCEYEHCGQDFNEDMCFEGCQEQYEICELEC